MKLTKLLRILAAGSLILTAGCSGHPGTGTWLADGPNDSGYWILKIEFDGKATMLGKTQAKPVMGCYWHATASDTISLQCATSKNQEDPETYYLKVSGDDRASFIRDDKLLAAFRRKP